MKYLLILVSILYSLSVFSQPRFSHYTTNNGLASNSINDILIESKTKIWIATDSGLSFFNGNSFQHYNSSNSSIPNNQILDLEIVGSTLYLSTSVGLTSFDGVTFTNYNTSNGLLTNSIKGLTSDFNGNLWIASLNGISKFDGSLFTHDSNKVAHDIVADTNNNIYITNYTVVFNHPTLSTCEYFDGTSWNQTNNSNFNFTINNAKLKRTRNNSLIILGSNIDFYSEIQYPFTLVKKQIFDENRLKVNKIRDVEIANDSSIWIGCDNPYPQRNLFKGVDTLFRGFSIQPLGLKFELIDTYDGVIVVSNDSGIYISESKIEPLTQNETISINKIKAGVNINGPLFNSGGNRANFQFPADSNTHGIYAANFIVSAKKQGNPNSIVHPISPFNPSLVEGPIGQLNTGKSYMVKVSKQEIHQHKMQYANPGYKVPSSIKNWPANGDTTLGQSLDLAPFYDVNQNGCYDPINGDYPAILGDEAVYWINHPDDSNLELEYHYMLYGFANIPNSPFIGLSQTVFLKYAIINRSNISYDSIKVGLFTDFDLGNSSDDYIGCDSLLNIAYAYNGDPFDDDINTPAGPIYGFGSISPAVGVSFLSDSMTSFISYDLGNAINGSPNSATDWNNYLNGNWKNGTSIKYGGNAYNSLGTTNFNTNHMYTGRPSTPNTWSELNPGGNQAANYPGDRRDISSMPSFSLAPGQRRVIDFAFGYGDAFVSQIGASIGSLMLELRNSKMFWDTLSFSGYQFGSNQNCFLTNIEEFEQNDPINQLDIYPNPNNGNLSIDFGENQRIESLEILDLQGRLVYSRQKINSRFVKLNIEELKRGTYFIKVIDNKQKVGIKKLVKL